MKKFNYYIFLLLISFLNGCGGNANHTPQKYFSANQALEQIYNLCEKPGYDESYPFCLTHNLRNIRQIIRPHLHKISENQSTDYICSTINKIFQKDLQLSHFYLKKNTIPRYSNLFLNKKFFSNSPPSESIILENYVMLLISDFEDNFNWPELKRGLEYASTHQKGIIICLIKNRGGQENNLNHLLSYFFPSNTVIAYEINRQHEQYLDPLENWIGNYSKPKMKSLINTVQSNWHSTNSPSKINPQSAPLLIQKKIAIIIDENSASCSEYFTMVLKEHYPDRVKIIGEKSAGSLGAGEITIHPEITLTFPKIEILSIHGTRVEGVGIEPDEKTRTITDATSVAINWVSQ